MDEAVVYVTHRGYAAKAPDVATTSDSIHPEPAEVAKVDVERLWVARQVGLTHRSPLRVWNLDCCASQRKARVLQTLQWQQWQQQRWLPVIVAVAVCRAVAGPCPLLNAVLGDRGRGRGTLRQRPNTNTLPLVVGERRACVSGWLRGACVSRWPGQKS